jgi:16S rRNA (guanine966-N2)-methyltransferase
MARRARGVRVVAGTLRGRRVAVPRGATVRPTADRVKESVFSALEARTGIAGASVLDLFAGSGALAIEALSRGARAAVLVERDRDAVAAIEQNLRDLDLRGRARVVRSDVGAFVRGTPPPEAPFGLVFADPPYPTSRAVLAGVLAQVASESWCARGATVVVEHASGTPLDVPGLENAWAREFGDTLVTFLQP